MSALEAAELATRKQLGQPGEPGYNNNPTKEQVAGMLVRSAVMTIEDYLDLLPADARAEAVERLSKAIA